jgi:hypothetical protein
MKMSMALFGLAILALGGVLAACSPAQPTAAPSPTLEAYPVPQEVIPPANPYPGPASGGGTSVDWAKAEETILSGQVAQVYVNNAGYVTLVLKDQSVLFSQAPSPEEVSKVVERCGDACKGLQVVKE